MSVVNNARAVWNETIDGYGRLVTFADASGNVIADNVRAFCKRPKILGLFDRTQQSYDQERYFVIVKAESFTNPGDLVKFTRVRWDDEDHAILSKTEVELRGILIGLRFLVKG